MLNVSLNEFSALSVFCTAQGKIADYVFFTLNSLGSDTARALADRLLSHLGHRRDCPCCFPSSVEKMVPSKCSLCFLMVLTCFSFYYVIDRFAGRKNFIGFVPVHAIFKFGLVRHFSSEIVLHLDSKQPL